MSWDNNPPIPRAQAVVSHDAAPPGVCAIPGYTLDRVVFADGFGGTNDLQLTSPWFVYGDSFIYQDGTAIEDPGGDGSSNFLLSKAFTNGYAQARCLGVGAVHHVVVRKDIVAAQKWYAARVSPDGVSLTRGSAVLASVSDPLVPGQLLRLEARGRNLKVIYNGVTLIDYTDNSESAVLTSRLPGILGSDALGAVFDDFQCGTLAIASGWDPTPPVALPV